ncbi:MULTISPECIES: VOC family protein [Erysipelotrichaceae]|nr:MULTISPECIES: VOC family protein [Erysipelotrichaceae]
MRLDGIQLMVENMPKMVRFYRDVLGFEITEGEDTGFVYLVKDHTLFMLYKRESFEFLTCHEYNYCCGINGHFEISLSVNSFKEVDKAYEEVVAKGANAVYPPTTEFWGQRTCVITDPENNLIEISAWENNPYQTSFDKDEF